MKKLLPFLFVLCSLPCFAITYVLGPITNDTWTKAKSPYMVTSNINVYGTLLIEPGVVVLMRPGTTIFVENTIYAVGTATDSITFIPEKTSWVGIEIFYHPSNSPLSAFSYCNFKGASRAITLFGNTNLNIENCTFTDNKVALAVAGGNFSMSNNSITGGIALSTINAGQINYDRLGSFSNNTLSGSRLSDFDFFDSLVIQNNTLRNTTCGMDLRGQFGKLTVSGNTITLCDTAVLLGGSLATTTFTNNIVALNKTGLVVNIPGGNISANTIKKNHIGIRWLNPGMALQFTNNCIDTSYKYNVYLESSGNYNLGANWWGTTDPALLAMFSYDAADDATKGELSFLPLLTDPSQANCKPTPRTTGIETPATGITPSFYPNPASGKVTFRLPSATIQQLDICTIAGSRVISIQSHASAVEADLAPLPTGLYIFKLTDSYGQLHTGRVLKQ